MKRIPIRTVLPLIKKHSLILSLTCGGILSAPAFAADTAKPNADLILRGMSTKLSVDKQFTFKAHREMDPALAEGRHLPEKADIAAAVSRPNQIAVRSVSKERTMHFIANGKTLTIFDETKNHYSQVPMRTSIDGLVDRLDKEYGFVPPLADFAVKDPYKELRQQVHSVAYVGRERLSAGFFGLSSVACDHLALQGREAHADLWIAANSQLPRKMVATFHRPGHPQLRIDFSDWNFAAAVPDSTFAFKAPKGAQKIEMWTTAKMQAVTRKH